MIVSKRIESVSSHIVSLEALFFILINDLHEGCDVANFCIPGTYIHVELSKYKRILIKLGGDFSISYFK